MGINFLFDSYKSVQNYSLCIQLFLVRYSPLYCRGSLFLHKSPYYINLKIFDVKCILNLFKLLICDYKLAKIYSAKVLFAANSRAARKKQNVNKFYSVFNK